MRYSVEAGLHCIQTRFTPPDAAWWLLVPADHPVLDGSVVTELITAASQSTADILVPVHQGRRGHPTAFRWSLAEQVSRIPQNRGLNWLVKHDSVSVEECEFSTDSILLDLDTPEDFERLTRRIDHY